jgi:hypothetical protein
VLISFDLRGFRADDDDLARAYLRPLVYALCAANEAFLRANPDTPRLYAAGVRYQREPAGDERWRDVPAILNDGYGDCEDLASWRVAELRVQGVPARPIVRVRRRPGRTLFHVLVGVGDRREDPSRRLGMGT